MTDWHSQAEYVRRALADSTKPALDELLILRDLEGRVLRPTSPPQGVSPREAAVIILLIPAGDDLLLPLTVRSTALVNHSGEVSLPGGSADPDDESLAATALRECYEELGISPAAVEVWGMLTPIYIPPSNFRITPVVGFTPDTPTFKPNPTEVAMVLLARLNQLLDPSTVVIEEWERRGITMRVPFFNIEGHKVWGATALVLSELVARMRRV